MIEDLKGKRILVTREESQAKIFAEKITRHGGRPIVTPLIKISCDKSWQSSTIVDRIEQAEWLFFTSANGVRCFFKSIGTSARLRDLLEQKSFAVVGEKTKKALEAHRFSVDFLPTRYDAKTMAKEFSESYPGERNLLLIRGNLSRKVLPEALGNKGYRLDTLTVYRTEPNEGIRGKLQEVMEEPLDFITFTSPSTVDAYVDFLGEGGSAKGVFVCIGATTEAQALKYGLQPVIRPDIFTIDEMIRLMALHIEKEG